MINIKLICCNYNIHVSLLHLALCSFGSSAEYQPEPEPTIILGGDFNTGDIDWESHTVCEHSLNRQINEKIVSVISSSGLVQIKKDGHV